MRRIQAYKADDGSIHELEADAARRDAEVALRAFLDDRGVGRGGMWDIDMFYSLVLEDARELYSILGRYLTSVPSECEG